MIRFFQKRRLQNLPLAGTNLMLLQFSEMLDEIATAGIVIDPDGTSEPHANLCTISLSGEQADGLHVDDVVVFLGRASDCFDTLRQSAFPDHPMVFYAWVDDMAGQLRFSVVSSLPLPFGVAIRIVRDPTVISRQLLGCSHFDGIPLNEMEPSNGDSSEPESAVLDVCVIDLPRCEAPS